MVSFSMQVVWMYLSQRRGGAETPTQHFTCRSLRKFSSRVHLLNKTKLLNKTLRTENIIILTPRSFEKRSPKRVALIINI